MPTSPLSEQPGQLYVAAPDALDPEHYSHGGKFGGLWTTDWTLIGRTDPEHCIADGALWTLALSDVVLARQQSHPDWTAAAKWGWESEDGKWRMIAPVRAPKTQEVPLIRKPASTWPIHAVLEDTASWFHAVTTEEHNAEVRAAKR